MATAETNTDNDRKPVILGIVKFWDHRRKYGFIKALSSDAGAEYFVHETGIIDDPLVPSFKKYLVKGEYVNFIPAASSKGNGVQATWVRGVNNGPLMHQTRFYELQERRLRDRMRRPPAVGAVGVKAAVGAAVPAAAAPAADLFPGQEIM